MEWCAQIMNNINKAYDEYRNSNKNDDKLHLISQVWMAIHKDGDLGCDFRNNYVWLVRNVLKDKLPVKVPNEP